MVRTVATHEMGLPVIRLCSVEFEYLAHYVLA